jgi:hypothetical protein
VWMRQLGGLEGGRQQRVGYVAAVCLVRQWRRGDGRQCWGARAWAGWAEWGSHR